MNFGLQTGSHRAPERRRSSCSRLAAYMWTGSSKTLSWNARTVHLRCWKSSKQPRYRTSSSSSNEGLITNAERFQLPLCKDSRLACATGSTSAKPRLTHHITTQGERRFIIHNPSSLVKARRSCNRDGRPCARCRCNVRKCINAGNAHVHLMWLPTCQNSMAAGTILYPVQNGGRGTSLPSSYFSSRSFAA